MPQLSLTRVMFWARRSQAATFLSGAACGAHDAQATATMRTSFFMRAPS